MLKALHVNALSPRVTSLLRDSRKNKIDFNRREQLLLNDSFCAVSLQEPRLAAARTAPGAMLFNELCCARKLRKLR